MSKEVPTLKELAKQAVEKEKEKAKAKLRELLLALDNENILVVSEKLTAFLKLLVTSYKRQDQGSDKLNPLIGKFLKKVLEDSNNFQRQKENRFLRWRIMLEFIGKMKGEIGFSASCFHNVLLDYLSFLLLEIPFGSEGRLSDRQQVTGALMLEDQNIGAILDCSKTDLQFQLAPGQRISFFGVEITENNEGLKTQNNPEGHSTIAYEEWHDAIALDVKKIMIETQRKGGEIEKVRERRGTDQVNVSFSDIPLKVVVNNSLANLAEDTIDQAEIHSWKNYFESKGLIVVVKEAFDKPGKKIEKSISTLDLSVGQLEKTKEELHQQSSGFWAHILDLGSKYRACKQAERYLNLLLILTPANTRSINGLINLIDQLQNWKTKHIGMFDRILKPDLFKMTVEVNNLMISLRQTKILMNKEPPEISGDSASAIVLSLGGKNSGNTPENTELFETDRRSLCDSDSDSDSDEETDIERLYDYLLYIKPFASKFDTSKFDTSKFDTPQLGG